MADCVTEASNIADAIFEVVKKNQTYFSGSFGNIVCTFTGGHCAHGCLKWQELVLQGYKEGVRRTQKEKGKTRCFAAAGVGKFYPFTDFTSHNWVVIYGPKVPWFPSDGLVSQPGVHIDPWPHGGRRLFPDRQSPVDGVLIPPSF